jgi:hypothetical protein
MAGARDKRCPALINALRKVESQVNPLQYFKTASFDDICPKKRRTPSGSHFALALLNLSVIVNLSPWSEHFRLIA